MSSTDITTITLKKNTKKRLELFGRKNESFDELINRLLDKVKEKKP